MALTRRKILRQEPIAPTKQDLLNENIAKLTDDVNSTETEVRLQRLHSIATRPLSLLSSEQCADLEAIRKLAKRAYDTEVYSILHSKITNLFNRPMYSPHTVGSFFVGCLTPTNLAQVAPDVNPGCSLLCSDAFPPANKKWGFCSQNTLWCVLSSSVTARNAREAVGRQNLVHMDISGPNLPESFDFIYITQISSSSKAILFLDYSSYSDFPGFTKHEKARLIKRMKITDVKLLSYEKDESGLNYKDLIGATTKVQAIKSRPDARDSETLAQRTARKSQVSKQSATDSDSPLSWQQAVGLALALAMLVILGICATFVIGILSTSKTKKLSRR